MAIQKRFVIQGQPGTGKTELALKYAEEHARQYWGVFWVDASSRANAALSYAKIASCAAASATSRPPSTGCRHPCFRGCYLSTTRTMINPSKSYSRQAFKAGCW